MVRGEGMSMVQCEGMPKLGGKPMPVYRGEGMSVVKGGRMSMVRGGGMPMYRREGMSMVRGGRMSTVRRKSRVNICTDRRQYYQYLFGFFGTAGHHRPCTESPLPNTHTPEAT